MNLQVAARVGLLEMLVNFCQKALSARAQGVHQGMWVRTQSVLNPHSVSGIEPVSNSMKREGALGLNPFRVSSFILPTKSALLNGFKR